MLAVSRECYWVGVAGRIGKMLSIGQEVLLSICTSASMQTLCRQLKACSAFRLVPDYILWKTITSFH